MGVTVTLIMFTIMFGIFGILHIAAYLPVCLVLSKPVAKVKGTLVGYEPQRRYMGRFVGTASVNAPVYEYQYEGKVRRYVGYESCEKHLGHVTTLYIGKSGRMAMRGERTSNLITGILCLAVAIACSIGLVFVG